MTFQWPGGVSDFGPSAQNSVSARVKSPVFTRSGAYGLFAVYRSTDGGTNWTAQVRNTDSKKLNTVPARLGNESR